jgi:hypothetical protein
MSPTILELVVLIILIITAWQLGVVLAPIIWRELRSMKQSLDDVSDEVTAEEGQHESQKGGKDHLNGR